MYHLGSQETLTKNFLTKKCKSIVRGEWMSSKKLFLSSAILFVLVSVLFIGSVKASSEMWSRTYGGKRSDAAYALVETSEGGYALAGYTWSFGETNNMYIWLVKTDANGNMLWDRTYGKGRAQALVETSDGGYAIAGVNRLVKTDADGNMEWNRTYSGGTAYSLVQTSDGGYAITGTKNNDFSLVKIDASGNMEWNRTYGGTNHEQAYSMIKTSDGGYALAGATDSFGAGEDDFWLVKTDEHGNMEWNQTYGGEDIDRAYSLVETSDGGYAIAGGWLLVKTDRYGNTLWYHNYGGTGTDRFKSLVETSDGGFAIAGYTESFGAGGFDFWLVKTDEYGVIPEFPSWIILPLFLIATASTIVVRKRISIPAFAKIYNSLHKQY